MDVLQVQEASKIPQNSKAGQVRPAFLLSQNGLI
jgi:hypothetical protein